jgi:hypothetical protein
VRQPSGGGGQPECGDEKLGDAEGDDQRRDTVSGIDREGIETRGSSGTVADPSERQLPKPRRGSEGRDGTGSGGASVDDSSGSRCDRAWSGPSANREGGECVPGAGCTDMAGSAGREGGERGGAPGQRHGPASPGPVAEFSEIPLFAPGPGAVDQWASIIARWPWLAPAVEEEIESPFCRITDGVAGRVGSSRADELRCAGNGVVVQCAALAFLVLATRSGIIPCHDVGLDPDA